MPQAVDRRSAEQRVTQPDAEADQPGKPDPARREVRPVSECRTLLFIRVAENQAGQTWPFMRRELDRIHLGTFTGEAGTFRQRTDLTKPARDLLSKLGIDPPRRIHELTAAT